MSQYLSGVESENFRGVVSSKLSSSSITATKMSRVLMCSRSTLYSLLREDGKRIKVKYAENLCNYFGKSISDVAGSAVTDSYELSAHLRKFKDSSGEKDKRTHANRIAVAISDYIQQQHAMTVTYTVLIQASGNPESIVVTTRTNHGTQVSFVIDLRDANARMRVNYTDDTPVGLLKISYVSLDAVVRWMKSSDINISAI